MAALTTAPTALAGVAPDLEQSLQRMYRSSSESVVCGRCATSVTFQTSVTLRTQDLRKAAPLISFASTHHKRRARPNRGNAQCWWRVSRVLVAQSAGKRCHCGLSSLKDRVSTRRLSNARNAMTPEPWWRRYPLLQRSLFRQDRFVLRATCAAATGYENIKFGDNQAASAFGIDGNTTASIAMTASRFMPFRVDQCESVAAVLIGATRRAPLKEASMRIRKIRLTTQISVALGFGLAAAALFWWEVAKPISSSGWSGSTEQCLALASVAIGVCAMLVAFSGALLAVSKTPQRRD
jgi:hypothetical protein